jgi:hypothetical protein
MSHLTKNEYETIYMRINALDEKENLTHEERREYKQLEARLDAIADEHALIRPTTT